MIPELMTIDDFCKFTSTGKTKVYAEISAGRLKAIKYGRCTRISRSAMEKWISMLPNMGCKADQIDSMDEKSFSLKGADND